jgi:23S rRNA pseudouridine2605 synthase
MVERLQKYIASAGICSRRKAEELIKKELVIVNNKIAEIGMNVDPSKDTVIVQGTTIKPEKHVYLVLNKPSGFITTVSDPYNRDSVVSLVHEQKRVFPIGRLDKDTTGMLLLTNDGDFVAINEGVILNRKKIEAKVRKLSNKRALITVHTGINKEIKRIFSKVGYWVVSLKRTQIGPLKLDVREGKYRHLVDSEVDKLRRLYGEK